MNLIGVDSLKVKIGPFVEQRNSCPLINKIMSCQSFQKCLQICVLMMQ